MYVYSVVPVYHLQYSFVYVNTTRFTRSISIICQVYRLSAVKAQQLAVTGDNCIIQSVTFIDHVDIIIIININLIYLPIYIFCF